MSVTRLEHRDLELLAIMSHKTGEALGCGLLGLGSAFLQPPVTTTFQPLTHVLGGLQASDPGAVCARTFVTPATVQRQRSGSLWISHPFLLGSNH